MNNQNARQTQQKQFYYNKKLLENMSTLLGYIETSRQDLLNATKTLLFAYKSEFEANQSLQDDINKFRQDYSVLEIARNKVELDLLRTREAYNKELVKSEEMFQKVKFLETKLNELQSKIKNSQISEDIKKCLLETSSFPQSQTGTPLVAALTSAKNNPVTQECSSMSPTQVSSHNNIRTPRSGASTGQNSYTTTFATNFEEFQSTKSSVQDLIRKHNENTFHSERKSSYGQKHNFELVKNKLRFHSCYSCKNSIMPLVNYYHCKLCDTKIDKNCFEQTIWFPCVSKIKKTISLSSMPVRDKMVPDLLVKCCEAIEQQGIESDGLYRHNEDKKAVDLFERYLALKDLDTLKLHKLNVHTLCALVIHHLRSLDEPLIVEDLWNDLTRACDQKDLDERNNLLEHLIQQMSTLPKHTLAFLMLHVKQVLAKSFSNNLDRQTIVNLFGPFVTKGKILNLTKHDQIKLLNMQTQIMDSLLDIPKEFWKVILNETRGIQTPMSTLRERRRTTVNYRDILNADQMRVSFCEKISNSIY